MLVRFEETDRKKILDSIHSAMGDRPLRDLVDFSNEGGKLIVTISKLGTSKLIFGESAQPDHIMYKLEKEKIAFAHKAFKDDVTKKILKVIESAGGKIT